MFPTRLSRPSFLPLSTVISPLSFLHATQKEATPYFPPFYSTNPTPSLPPSKQLYGLFLRHFHVELPEQQQEVKQW